MRRRWKITCVAPVFLSLVLLVHGQAHGREEHLLSVKCLKDPEIGEALFSRFHGEVIYRPAKPHQQIDARFVLLVESGSDLLLRLATASEEDDISPSLVISYLEKILGPGQVIVTNSELIRCKFSQSKCTLLDISDLPAQANLWIENFSGNIYVVTKVEQIFSSRVLNALYDDLVAENAVEGSRERIHLRHVEKNDLLPFNSLIVVDEDSELTLKLESTVEDDNLTQGQQLEQISEAIHLPGEIKVSNGKYYKTVPQGSLFIVRDQADILRKFHLFVADCRGNVFVSTDVDAIAQIGDVTEMHSLSRERDREGFISAKPPDGALGLFLSDETTILDGHSGIVVLLVYENSLAHRAGLLPGDLILKVDGYAFRNREEFMRLLDRAKEESSVDLSVYRKGKVLRITASP